ncbi:MAG: general secretion pathway protein GspD [Bacteroidia bacterium]|nr:general secretion pathway protein GspD [Bacteroidia bacterium]
MKNIFYKIHFLKNAKSFFLLLFLFLCFSINAQTDRFAIIKENLDSLSKTYPGLSQKIEFTVNGASIQEFIRNVAATNSLNVNVDPGLTKKITNNFTGVTVSEVLLFLSKNYELDITFTGPIMSITPYVAPVTAIKVVTKKLKIEYDKITSLVVMDLQNDSLASVAKALTLLTGKNIVFSPDLLNKTVSGYFQSLPLNKALENMAFTNELKVESADGQTFYIEKKEKESLGIKNPGNVKSGSTSNAKGLTLTSTSGLLDVQANNVEIKDLVDAASAELKLSYYLFTDLKGNTSLNIKQSTNEDLLKNVFNGTEYTSKKENGVYLIGDRSIEGLRATKLIQLRYRSADKLIDVIPAELKKGLDLKAFPDLNGIIASGSQPRLDELELFMMQIDQVVPVIAIEVMIVDISDSKTVATGIQAGIGTAPVNANQTVFPSIDINLNSSAINNVISGLNGFGGIILGNVTPNFYLKLKALEEQGYLKLRSTPQLSTLNGSPAKLSIGKTEYYLEQTNTNLGGLNATVQTAIQYKSVSADLSVGITPMVSLDEQITLDIAVKQSSFTPRISPTAPPGSITRDFKSMIRVKNGEMVMLGGLEEESTNNTSSGTPFLSRIPIIKWFFSSRTKAKSNSKLTIFIRPIIIY